MNKIKIIKKFKAYFIRLRIHKLFGFTADYLIYFGYLLKMSKWIDNNKDIIRDKAIELIAISFDNIDIPKVVLYDNREDSATNKKTMELMINLIYQ